MTKKIISFNCNSCGGRFVAKELLFIHKASSHLGLRISKCIVCEFSDPSKEKTVSNQAFAIMTHILEAHKSDIKYKTQYNCKTCPFSASSLEQVKIHFNREHLKANNCTKRPNVCLDTKSLTRVKNTAACSKLSEKGIQIGRRTNTGSSMNIEEIQEIANDEILCERNINERPHLLNKSQLETLRSELVDTINLFKQRDELTRVRIESGSLTENNYVLNHYGVARH